MEHCLTIWAVFKYFLPIGQGDLYCDTILGQPLQPFSLGFLAYAKLFGLTCLLEGPLYYLGFHFFAPQWSVKKKILVILGLNLLTHPIVCFVLPAIGHAFFRWAYVDYLVIAEIFAPTAEAIALGFILKKEWWKAIALSFTANLVSWNIGVLLT